MSSNGLDRELRGPHVVLRRFRADEMDAVWEGHQGLEPMVMPIVPDRRRLERRIQRSGELVSGEIDLAIEVDGRLIGTIQTHNAPPVSLRPGVYEVGILIWNRTDRGHGHGSEAIALFTTWLFDEAGARRVQAGTSPGNVPMRRSLEGLGFLERGVVTGPGGEYVLYAVGDAEWRARAFDPREGGVLRPAPTAGAGGTAPRAARPPGVPPRRRPGASTVRRTAAGPS